MHNLVGSDSHSGMPWMPFREDEENERNVRFVGLKSTEILRAGEESRATHSDELGQREILRAQLCISGFQSSVWTPAKRYGDRKRPPNFRRYYRADVYSNNEVHLSESRLGHS
eukprot:gene4025-14104_t